ncbi:MAG: hypothetical protein MH204_07145 [Fimbriimonadaceae bacterium]|nr:hypothetical protein [Fimbriimonadaceae bacterium]
MLNSEVWTRQRDMHGEMADRLCRPILEGRRAVNQACWADRNNWVFGFYFGAEDSRLWVPRMRRGEPDDDVRVLNFAHPLGRPASRILLLAYLIGGIFFGLLISSLFRFFGA